MSIGLATKIEAIKTVEKLKDDTFGKHLAQRMERKEPYSRDAVGKWKRGERNPEDDARQEIDVWYYDSLDALAGQDPHADMERRRSDIAALARRLNPRNLEKAFALLDDMVFAQQLEERGLTVGDDMNLRYSPNTPTEVLAKTKARSVGGDGQEGAGKNTA